jgi:hypothetical protein
MPDDIEAQLIGLVDQGITLADAEGVQKLSALRMGTAGLNTIFCGSNALSWRHMSAGLGDACASGKVMSMGI